MDDPQCILDGTLRLYSPAGAQRAFWWAFEHNGTIYIDSGPVGQRGQRRRFPSSEIAKVNAEVGRLQAAGYSEIDEDDMATVDIVYSVDGEFGSGAELDRRNELLERMDEFLALTGQGWVDGAGSGMGTMEVTLRVVDPAIAERSIADELSGTKHANYKEIFVYPPEDE